jgi:hypothetical protein
MIYLLDIICRFIFIGNDVSEVGLSLLPPVKCLFSWAQSTQPDIWTISIDWASTVSFLTEEGNNPVSETSFQIKIISQEG